MGDIGGARQAENGRMPRAHLRKFAAVLPVLIGALIWATSSLGAPPALRVGGESTRTSACDGDGLGVAFVIEWDAEDGRFEVAAVTVRGLSGECAGDLLTVVLTGVDETTLASESATVPPAGTREWAVAVSPGVSAETLAQVHAVVVGAG